MLREILLSGRDDFTKGNFPPPNFEGAKASAPVADWIATKSLSEAERERIEALMVYWGGNPTDPDQVASISVRVFHAFGLEPPKGLGSPRSPLPPPTPDRPTPPTPPVPMPDVTAWSRRLDEWAGGIELDQRHAQKLRSILLRHLEKAIPWNRLRLGKRNPRLLLTIPNARGNEAPAAIRLAIAEDHKDPQGQLRLTFLGALRLDRSRGELNYLEADEDSARVATLVERLVEDLIPHLERARHRQVRVLSWILGRQARVLGLLPPASGPLFDSNVLAVRNSSDEEAQELHHPLDGESPWQQLRCEVMQTRPDFQRVLWDRIGCFQGDGKTVHALDPTLLIDGELEQPDTKFLDSNQRAHFSKLRPARLQSAVRRLVAQLASLSAHLDNLLGSKHDEQDLLSALGKLLDALEPVGVWPESISHAELTSGIEAFRNDDLKNQLDEVAPLLDPEAEIDLTADATLERLGRLNLSVIERSEAFLNRIEIFVEAVERDLNVKERELTGLDPKGDATALGRILDQVDRDLRTIDGETTL